MEREIEKDLIEIECAIKSQEEKDNIFTMFVLQRCHKLVSQLKEYKDLEEQGKLLKPKCFPGDYVWEINKGRKIISECEVVSIRYGINKTFRYMWTLIDGIYGDLEGFRDDEIGKTVFLTRKEAEAALKEL